MKKVFNMKMDIKTQGGDSEEFNKMYEEFQKNFSDFDEMSVIKRDDLTVTVKDGIISIKGSPKAVMLEDKELFKSEETCPKPEKPQNNG